MSFILNLLLRLLRGQVKEMMENPAEKIEKTLDTTTLIWMLLYGTYPYPTAQQQIEEKIGYIERMIEENPEQARQGFTWLYRIVNTYRLIHVQPVWINDLLSCSIKPLETKSVDEPFKVSDLLGCRISNPITKEVSSKTPEKIILSDSLMYSTYSRIQQLFSEYVSLSDAVGHEIKSLIQRILAESITLSDALNSATKTRTTLQYDETLTLSDEILSEIYSAPQHLTLSFIEIVKVLDTKHQGYPYPEQPEITYMQYNLAETVGLSEMVTPIVTPWLEGWSYRKSHVIIGSTSEAVTDYQVKIVVHYDSGEDSGENVYLNGKCRTDFGDIRFTDSDGATLLDYWMEKKVDGEYAVFWVKVPNIPLSPESAIIYIYYGKSDALTTSNGENTFEFFDDFLGTSLDASKWVDESESKGVVTVANSYVELDSPAGTDTRAIIRSVPSFTGGKALEYRYKYIRLGVQSSHQVQYIDRYLIGGVEKFESEYQLYDYQLKEIISSVSRTRDSKDKTWSLNVWYRESLRMYTSIARVFLNDVEELTGSLEADHTAQNLHIRLVSNGWGGGNRITVRFDFIALRKYVDPEPSHGAWGEEETLS